MGQEYKVISEEFDHSWPSQAGNQMDVNLEMQNLATGEIGKCQGTYLDSANPKKFIVGQIEYGNVIKNPQGYFKFKREQRVDGQSSNDSSGGAASPGEDFRRTKEEMRRNEAAMLAITFKSASGEPVTNVNDLIPTLEWFEVYLANGLPSPILPPPLTAEPGFDHLPDNPAPAPVGAAKSEFGF